MTPEIVLAALAAAFWLRGAGHLAWLLVASRGEPNGARQMIGALAMLLTIRGAELVYVAAVWTIPIEARSSSAAFEHAVRSGYLVFSLAAIVIAMRLAGSWRRQREKKP